MHGSIHIYECIMHIIYVISKCIYVTTIMHICDIHLFCHNTSKFFLSIDSFQYQLISFQNEGFWSKWKIWEDFNTKPITIWKDTYTICFSLVCKCSWECKYTKYFYMTLAFLKMGWFSNILYKWFSVQNIQINWTRLHWILRLENISDNIYLKNLGPNRNWTYWWLIGLD